VTPKETLVPKALTCLAAVLVAAGPVESDVGLERRDGRWLIADF
jgi:hypothetical protein